MWHFGVFYSPVCITRVLQYFVTSTVNRQNVAPCTMAEAMSCEIGNGTPRTGEEICFWQGTPGMPCPQPSTDEGLPTYPLQATS